MQCIPNNKKEICPHRRPLSSVLRILLMLAVVPVKRGKRLRPARCGTGLCATQMPASACAPHYKDNCD